MNLNKKLMAAAAAGICVFIFLVWWIGSSNPETQAGYAGYLTQGSVFGHTKFIGVQKGPTSLGMTWLAKVKNVSVTPYTFTEVFSGDSAVLAQDNLKLEFQAHVIVKVNPDQLQNFMDHYYSPPDKDTDEVTEAYRMYVREKFRTFVRDEVTKRNGLDVKANIITIGDAVDHRIQEYAKGSPFDVTSTVVGNIQYPPTVADAVANKLAATQELQQRDTQNQIAQKDAEKRVIDARGIAESMEIINMRLTTQYLQHEAIEAQKAMVGSPNHTTIYIPVGPMGVPVVSTVNQASK